MLNVSCVIFALNINMCKFQWRLMSLAPGGVCYGLRVSQLHLRLQNYAIVQPSKLFDFVPQTPTGRSNICFVA